MPGRLRIVWCYLGPPLTSLIFLRSRRPSVRFHAWQAFYFGLSFLLGLVGCTLTEVLVGQIHRAYARLIAYCVPAIGAIGIVLWLWCMVRLMQRGECHLPWVGRWATMRAQRGG
ncbi:MAG: hypothetical protein HYV02_04770 [Deltaproteobacteria bacterium]|nr:hypothetical protein [Deltaproteobacteria bacterium]